MPKSRGRLVYSTDSDAMPDRSSEKAPATSLPPAEQQAGLRRERKGRKGKTVTVVEGLVLSPEDLKALAKRLKRACGTGGTVKDGRIEIQGDHRDTIEATLVGLGYRTKRVGG